MTMVARHESAVVHVGRSPDSDANDSDSDDEDGHRNRSATRNNEDDDEGRRRDSSASSASSSEENVAAESLPGVEKMPVVVVNNADEDREPDAKTQDLLKVRTTHSISSGSTTYYYYSQSW